MAERTKIRYRIEISPLVVSQAMGDMIKTVIIRYSIPREKIKDEQYLFTSDYEARCMRAIRNIVYNRLGDKVVEYQINEQETGIGSISIMSSVNIEIGVMLYFDYSVRLDDVKDLVQDILRVLLSVQEKGSEVETYESELTI